MATDEEGKPEEKTKTGEEEEEKKSNEDDVTKE